jgi:hypothetical protein
MVEADPRVPQWVPQPLGQCGHAARPAFVHEKQVEIAVRDKLAPAEAADRDQRYPLVSAYLRLCRVRRQPELVQVGERIAKCFGREPALARDRSEQPVTGLHQVRR